MALSSLAAAALEGVGVGLLIPLLNLLISGSNPEPMRPIGIVQQWFPDKDSGFYVILFCAFIFAAVVLKNVVIIGSKYLSTKLKKTLSVNLKQSLFGRLMRAGWDYLNIEVRVRLPTCSPLRPRILRFFDLCLQLGEKSTIVFFYIVLILAISWHLTLMTLMLGLILGFSIGFILKKVALKDVA